MRTRLPSGGFAVRLSAGDSACWGRPVSLQPMCGRKVLTHAVFGRVVARLQL